MIFFSEHFQQLMWKNSRPVSNSARVSFNTVTFQYSSVGTRRKTHFWVQGGDFFFFHHILLKTGSPDCDSIDFWFFIFHHLPSCLPPFSNSQFYSWCKKTLLASNKTLNEIQERGSIDCIWLQSHFNPSPLHVRALDWRELQAEGGEGCWRFSIQPRSLCFTHMSGLISRCCNQECSDRKTRGVWENVKLTQMRGQGKQWQGQFQFPISPQIEVNRGARRLNEDIAASDHSSSARHTVPTGHLKRIRHRL